MKLDRVQPTKIEDMNIGELEIALFQRKNALAGGAHIIAYTTLALIIFWLLGWFVMTFLTMLVMLFWISAFLSIRRDIKRIQYEINDTYGVDND